MSHLPSVEFNYSELESFKEWLRLDLENITWQGEFLREFDLFWHRLFEEGISLAELHERLLYLSYRCRHAGLKQWFVWLKQKSISYCFVFKKISAQDLATILSTCSKEICWMLEIELTSLFPEHSLIIRDYFTYGSNLLLDEEVNLDNLKKKVDLNFKKRVLPRSQNAFLEVTIIDDWKRINKILHRAFLKKKKFNLDEYKKLVFSRTFVRSSLAYVLFTFLIFLGLQSLIFFSKKYDAYLKEQVRLFDSASILSKVFIPLISKAENSPKKTGQLDIAFFDQGFQDQFDFEQGTVSSLDLFEEESLLDVQTIDEAKEFRGQDSDYEENDKRDFRDRVGARNKIYRVLVKSSNPSESREYFFTLLEKFKMRKGDRVKLGTQLPGGYYYNTFIKNEDLKKFLKEVDDQSEVKVYESRSREENPRGETRILIWIKTL